MSIFKSTTLSSGSSMSSDWIRLFEDFQAHAIGGKFTSSDGTGKLALTYCLASRPSDSFQVSQGDVLTATATTPFLKSMQLRASYYIKFTATASVKDLTGINVDFIQTGRGS